MRKVESSCETIKPAALGPIIRGTRSNIRILEVESFRPIIAARETFLLFFRIPERSGRSSGVNHYSHLSPSLSPSPIRSVAPIGVNNLCVSPPPARPPQTA